MNEAVKKVLDEQIWSLATCGEDGPNVVPIGFKKVLDDGSLAAADVFMNTTLKNIAANGKVAVSVFDPATAEGYQVKGTAKHVTEGPVVAAFEEMALALFKGAAHAKGAVIITPETVIVTSPGPNNNKAI